VANCSSIPYSPQWSIGMLAVDVRVIWALMVHGRREATL
jgi:hypothetical protein